MNKFIKITVFCSITLLLINCSKKDSTIPKDVAVQNFIWKGLNAYYLWQPEIADLADTRFSSNEQLTNYLSGYNDPSNLFENLLYKRDTIDKWSWIVSDYVALEQSFKGVTKTNGMEFGLVYYKSDNSKVFGFVKYVAKETDAEAKGVTRGMIFTEINGIQLTPNNYKSLLFSSADSYTISLADYNYGDPITNETTINLSKSEYLENPIYKTAVFNEGSKKIGYLLYNGFVSDFDDDLNAVFADFKAAGIDDLIIDLRYNGGGSVRTAVYLASMITGQFTGQLFAKELWNPKVEAVVNPEYLNNNFRDQIKNSNEETPRTINSLALNSIYFITTGNSASASELVINGLIPYLGKSNVNLIGTKTHGKYVGSVTLYDSPDFSKENVNPDHTWAMQPIVLEMINKDGTNNKDGFEPTIKLPEDYGNLGVLGDTDEPLLHRAITFITTGSRQSTSTTLPPQELKEFTNSMLQKPTHNNMYVKLK
ncbi:S41 family peptidase [Tenacibaculum sp. UWU-22]|uniref:S41 family peptidase n=1 Tax=Tenacibaculum sp. UWU-22 TaxID=3234187 RepID=UPI0034DAE0A3